MNKHVEILEACPRDGWQNHSVIIPTEQKLKYIRQMIDYGARKIDATSFVNPKYVPQMAGADDVIRGASAYADEKGVELYALTLNQKGVERAVGLSMRHVEFVLSASEEHNMRNSRKSISESIEDMKRLIDVARGLHITLGLACVFGSPFGDEVAPERVLSICQQAAELGITEVGLADTAGISDPDRTAVMLEYLKKYMDVGHISVHLHDTMGMGLANAYVALKAGVSRFETALAGMGGCPFVAGAKGNIATEDFVNMAHRMGYETGIDLEAALRTAEEMCAEIGFEGSSSMMKASCR